MLKKLIRKILEILNSENDVFFIGSTDKLP